MKRDTQTEQAVAEAMRKYNRKFFGQFAFVDQKLTQVALEAHIANETDPAELRQLCLAIIHSAY